jgi:hypothetical protein
MRTGDQGTERNVAVDFSPPLHIGHADEARNGI